MANINIDSVKRTLYRLYVGLTGEGNISGDHNIAKLSAVVSEVFESYTLISAIGNTQNHFEETTIVEIAVPNEKEKYVFAVAELIREHYGLDAIGICKVGDYMRVVKQ